MKKFIACAFLGLLIFLGIQKESIETSPHEPAPVCNSTNKLTTPLSLGKTEKTNVKDLNPETLRQKWKIQDYHEMAASEFSSPLGKTLVYSFSQGNIPIVGMEIRVRLGLDGSVLEEENTYAPIPNIDVDPQKIEEQITFLNNQTEGRFQFDNLNPNSLVIFKRANLSQGELAVSSQASDSFREGKPVQLLLRLEDGRPLMKTQGRAEFGI